MDTMMKRSMVALAAAFAALSTSALADTATAKAVQQTKPTAVKLTDAQLDGITAGAGAFSEAVIFNPGKAEVLKINRAHVTCINCVPIDVPDGTSGVMNVRTPNGKIISVTIRQSPF
jgi:hypothetical protein